MSEVIADYHVQPKRPWWLHPLLIVAVVALILIATGVGAMTYMNHWYAAHVKPLSNSQTHIRVTVQSGATVKEIGTLLQQKKVIRSASAFKWYVDHHSDQANLRAGTYLLSPSYSVAKIVGMMANGDVDNYDITLVPGERLDQIQEKLVKAGFDSAALKAALAKHYDLPIFAGKPANASLEGYIFPDTYEVTAETTPEQFLTKVFNNFYTKVQAAGYQAKLQQEGLSLYQGITLASIVQQEVGDANDQKMVAQVFLKRLKSNISLGSDVTFKYAAHKLGVPEDPNINSPYNTRINKGLPPGPIGNFSLSALDAVASPASTDYLFFVAGDDGKLYFSNTDAEHEQLIKEHCTKLCS